MALISPNGPTSAGIPEPKHVSYIQAKQMPIGIVLAATEHVSKGCISLNTCYFSKMPAACFHTKTTSYIPELYGAIFGTAYDQIAKGIECNTSDRGIVTRELLQQNTS